MATSPAAPSSSTPSPNDIERPGSSRAVYRDFVVQRSQLRLNGLPVASLEERTPTVAGHAGPALTITQQFGDSASDLMCISGIHESPVLVQLHKPALGWQIAYHHGESRRSVLEVFRRFALVDARSISTPHTSSGHTWRGRQHRVASSTQRDSHRRALLCVPSTQFTRNACRSVLLSPTACSSCSRKK